MIQIQNIQKSYGRKHVLKDISFSVESGESVAIVGRNGCGKSTLMQIMAGALRPDGGNILYFGQDLRKKPALFPKYCGYVPQDFPLMEELSVRDNLKLWNAGTLPNGQSIAERFDLTELLKQRVSSLSGGMKRRLSIACALAAWPPILLMDEPTTALDLYYKDDIRKWIADYRDLNGIVIITTHDEREILESDRCLVMYDGTLREVTSENRKLELIKEMMNGLH